MKKVLLLILIPLHLFSQDTPSNNNSISNLIAISSLKGTKVKQELTYLESVGNKYHINLIELTDQDKHNSASGIKFTTPNEPWGTIGYSSFADADEIGGLVSFLDFVKTLSKAVTDKTRMTEYSYTTSGNFRVCAILDFGESQWRKGVYVDKNYGNTFIELDSKEFLDFYNILVSAKSKLGK
jgi:sulfatase maturation enzyme AslB (radical SAM superfamily)